MRKMITMEEAKLYELLEELNNLRRNNAMLQNAVENMIDGSQGSVLIPRKNFVNIYENQLNKAHDLDDCEKSPIYSESTIISWNGICCDVSSGAIVYNEIISAIETVDDDLGGYEESYLCDVDDLTVSDVINSRFTVE